MKLVGDIEADGLLYDATQVWMCINYDLDERVWWIYSQEDFEWKRDDQYHQLSLDEMLKHLSDADELIYHNGMGYDFPLLEKLHGWDIDGKIDDVSDTMLMSSLFYPDRSWGHSLKEWGKRLAMLKGDHNEWHRWSQEMFDYCVQDVRITGRVYYELLRELETGYQY